jgi:hypothetical protein
VVLCFLALLLGRGAGLFPSPGAVTGTPPPPAPAAEQRVPDASPVPDEGDSKGVQADPLHSLRSTVDAAVRAGRLGAAYGSLAALPPAELPAVRARLDVELERNLTALAEELAQGRALAARQRLHLLLQERSPEVDAALARFCQGHAMPPFTTPASGAAVPVPEPLPRDLLLRSERLGTAAGRVVDARADEVTVRAVDQGGVTFPTLPVTEVEPVHPNAVLAAELGFAALRAGDALLARCWLACGLRDAEPPVRLQELAALLR